MAPLVVGIIWLGVYPAPVLRRMEPAAEQFVQLGRDARGRARPRLADAGGR